MFRSLKNYQYQMVRPVSVGLGGPFSALFSAFTGIHKVLPFSRLCPLWCFLLLPLTVVVPVFLPLFFLKSVVTQDKKKPDACTFQEEKNASAEDVEKTQVSQLEDANSQQSLGQYDISVALHEQMPKLILFEIIYLLVVAVVWFGIGFFSDIALYHYMQEAKANPGLQIATPSQIEFANTIVTIYSVAAMLILSALLVCFSATLVSVSGCLGKRRVLWTMLLKNSLSFALVYAFAYAVFVIVERYYAHLRMIALERIVQGLDYFDPSLPFIALRVYLAYAIIVALLLMVMTGLRALPKTWITTAS